VSGKKTITPSSVCQTVGTRLSSENITCSQSFLGEAILKPSSRKSSYEEPSYEDNPVLNFVDKGRGEYSSGDPLVLVFGNQLEGSGESRAPVLLPDHGPGSGGGCLARDVQFLRDFRSECVTRLTPEVCRSALSGTEGAPWRCFEVLFDGPARACRQRTGAPFIQLAVT